MKRIFFCLIVLCIVWTPSSTAQIKLDRITTINVSEAAPRDVFESIARLLECELAISPGIQKPVTMHLENVTVRTALAALSENLGCQWSMRGNTMHVEPVGTGKPGLAETVDDSKFNLMQKMECKTPSDFRFNNARLDNVAESLGKVCDMDIQFDISDKNRLLTIDLSNRTIFLALKTINEQLGTHKANIFLMTRPKSGQKMKIIMKESIEKR